MFFTYLGRELTKRRRQTALIAVGLSVAIALVMVVNSVAAGIASAQSTVLAGLYGIGTDITVSKSAAPIDFGGPRFQIGGSNGTTSGQTRNFNASRLEISRGASTLPTAMVAKISSTAGVSGAVATLKLNSITFSGSVPTFTVNQTTNNRFITNLQGGAGNSMQAPNVQPGSTSPSITADASATSSTTTTHNGPPQGGFDGKGGSQFGITSVSVEGVQASTSKIGPFGSAKLTLGRTLSSSDIGQKVAVLDSSYAASAKLALGSTVTLGGTKFKVVGVIAPANSSSTTSSNVYVPLDLAQSISGNAGEVTTVYVSAVSADQIASVKNALQLLDKTATVSTSADLASTISGSLGSASTLVNNAGGWLSALVLLGAFGMAILFTTSGVNRRTREFGTLKALGWRSRRVVAQVMGESLVTGLLGGLFGVVLGFAGIWAVNAFGGSLSASINSATGFGGQGGSGFPGGFRGPGGDQGLGGFAAHGAKTVAVSLDAPVSINIILLSIGLAVVGGLLAGAFGGLRAAKLSPAEALRSVA